MRPPESQISKDQRKLRKHWFLVAQFEDGNEVVLRSARSAQPLDRLFAIAKTRTLYPRPYKLEVICRFVHCAE